MAKMKSYASFDDYLAAQSLEHRRIIRKVRAFVSAAAPELAESVKWGNGCWLKGKVPVAYVYAGGPQVQFGFLLGSRLKDPRRLLVGQGRYVRHVPLSSATQLDPKLFGPLLRQAVRETPERLSDLSAGPKQKARRAPARPAARAGRASTRRAR